MYLINRLSGFAIHDEPTPHLLASAWTINSNYSIFCDSDSHSQQRAIMLPA